MVYLAAGASGLTAIAGTFFVKEYLGLSAEFLATLSFWAGIPWTLKIPLGHIVDLIWSRKAILVYLGAGLLATSMLIMFGLVAYPASMAATLSIEAWFVIATLLAPVGYVLQDVVADAMTVEAVPATNRDGRAFSDAESKSMHTTMQTFGRIAVILGSVSVALLNIGVFSDASELTEDGKALLYARLYLLALVIPLTSVIGVTIGALSTRAKRQKPTASPAITANWWILGGSAAFVIFTLGTGLSPLPFAQEIVFIGSLLIVLFILHRLVLELEPRARWPLLGTAIIIFVFRATPGPGASVTWWEIDVLGFDQQFLSVLTLVTAALTLAGMLLLRPLIATKSIANVVVFLSLASGLLMLPNIGLYYGLHEWTSSWSAGVIDARFIAILDTMLESPLGQIAMIPMLAWIAQNAPPNLKATFFAVLASFTNLALSASSLGTKYLNQIFTITREVKDASTGAVTIAADYSQVGQLLTVVAAIVLVAPIATVWLIQRTAFNTKQ